MSPWVTQNIASVVFILVFVSAVSGYLAARHLHAPKPHPRRARGKSNRKSSASRLPSINAGHKTDRVSYFRFLPSFITGANTRKVAQGKPIKTERLSKSMSPPVWTIIRDPTIPDSPSDSDIDARYDSRYDSEPMSSHADQSESEREGNWSFHKGEVIEIKDDSPPARSSNRPPRSASGNRSPSWPRTKTLGTVMKAINALNQDVALLGQEMDDKQYAETWDGFESQDKEERIDRSRSRSQSLRPRKQRMYK
ncbi:unnamed protein product [Zymoseptoria tritici ST99CH_1E4]|uniref:Uncharacterized protein n=1 Tax=Zymoseptoria tritici ST99CH_1E4 TaxID=1276532 RepID=A0A2H1H5G9_ZYMTR|nr:unnamed protein product [Zymoseptoria tritici ST99CH_1E4]